MSKNAFVLVLRMLLIRMIAYITVSSNELFTDFVPSSVKKKHFI